MSRVNLSADLAVTKAVDKTIPDIFDTVVYTVVVRNNGPSRAYSVVVKDLLPTGMQYASSTASPGTTYNANTGLWTVGTLPLSQQVTLHIVALVTSSTGGKAVVNTASIQSAGQSDPVSTNNSSSVTIFPQRADLDLQKIADPVPVIAGNTLHYTLTVTNNGPNTAQQVKVVDVLPAGVSLQGVTSPCTVAGVKITCAVNALAAKATVDYGIDIVHTVAHVITNTASVTSTTPDIVLSNNSRVLPVKVNPDAPVFLTLDTQPSASAVAGQALTRPPTVKIRDQFGNVVDVVTGSTDTVKLTAYLDSGCTTTPASGTLNNAVRAAVQGVSTFTTLNYTKAETIYLKATDSSRSGVTPVCSSAVLVNPAPATQLVYVTTPKTVTAGVISSILTVQRLDQFGNANSADAAIAVGLSSNSSGLATFFAAASSTVITQVVIPTGSSTASFRYSDQKAGAPVVKAASTGLTTASQTETILPAKATKLVFLSASQTITAGTITSLMTVQRQDQFGNPNTADATVTVNLSSNSSGNYQFRDQGNLSNIIAQVVIAQGFSTASFYYTDDKAGTQTVTASASGVLAQVSQQVTVVPAPATKLVFTTAAQTVTAGQFSGVITVQRQDQFDNPNSSDATISVGLSSNSSGSYFFVPTGNTSLITLVSIANGSSSASFRYTDQLAAVPTLTVATSGLTSATQSITIVPAGASQLVFVTSAQTITAGVVSQIITIQRLDQFGNPNTSDAAVTVLLSSDSSGTHVFRNTLNTQTITTIAIGQNSSTASFLYRDDSAGTPTITVADQAGL